VVVAYRPSTGGIISVDQTVGHGTSISNSATVNYDTLTPVGHRRDAGLGLVFNWSRHQWRDQRHSPDPDRTTRFDGGYADGFQSEAIATGARTSTLSASTAQSGMTVLLMESLPPTLPSVNLPPTMRGGF
jgi:hypothetical protein